MSKTPIQTKTIETRSSSEDNSINPHNTFRRVYVQSADLLRRDLLIYQESLLAPHSPRTSCRRATFSIRLMTAMSLCQDWSILFGDSILKTETSNGDTVLLIVRTLYQKIGTSWCFDNKKTPRGRYWMQENTWGGIWLWLPTFFEKSPPIQFVKILTKDASEIAHKKDSIWNRLILNFMDLWLKFAIALK